MKNIGYTFYQFSAFYASLFPYDSIDIFEKIFKIIFFKLKKYHKIDSFIYLILSNLKNCIYEARNYEKHKKYYLYYKKNEIVEKEMNKINNLFKENSNRNTFVIKHQKNIETFIENIWIYYNEQKLIKRKKILNIIIFVIKKYIQYIINYPIILLLQINKKAELFRKVIQFALIKQSYE